MSGLTLNDKPVSEATICAPRMGSWTIVARLASDETITGRATVVADGVTYVGTVGDGGLDGHSAEIFVKAGAGGLDKPARPRDEPPLVVPAKNRVEKG